MPKLVKNIANLINASEKLRFLIVGGYNTLFGYLAFALAYVLFGAQIHYTILVILVHFIALTNSFITQRFFVFKSRGPWFAEFMRFQVSYLALLPVGLGLLALLHDYAGLPVLLAQAYALVIMVVISYLSGRHFTFRKKA